MTVKSYDERSFDLARHFLEDEPGADRNDAHLLALAIQDTVEDWIEYTLRRRIAKDRAAARMGGG